MIPTDTNPGPGAPLEPRSVPDRVIAFFLTNRVVLIVLLLLAAGWGWMVAPFDWQSRFVTRDPVPVDAIPDIGENQQIVFTDWPGHSPQDVEDQITYPLSAALMGIRGRKTVRSFSMLGFSSIYVVFDDDVDFELSRQRVLEKLASLPANLLPEDVQPQLGPDATALGQVFWYTLEGQDARGRPTGGWDLQELRTIQDWYVRQSLMAARGVSEVASVGGYVQEYQVDVDPDAMRAAGVTLEQVYAAVRASNLDVGARTIEINSVEYLVRGLGLVDEVEDLAQAVVAERDNIPITVGSIAHVTIGPALRRGALDKEGAEVVGGVVVVRHGANPLEVIGNVKRKIEEITPGLPRKTLADGAVSQVRIVPFYDRTGLIYETLGTLGTALRQQVLVTVIVVLVMVMHLRSSLLIAGLLPLAILMSFIGMKVFGIDANIVALSGIAIAIGTMVDMGIILCENILREMDEAPAGESRLRVVFRAASQVGGAVTTAAATTIIGFLPVFAMEAAEGKLFKPLAFTKTFALVASLIIALAFLPGIAHAVFALRAPRRRGRWILAGGLAAAGAAALALGAPWWAAAVPAALGLWYGVEHFLPQGVRRLAPRAVNLLLAVAVAAFLAADWAPLGPEKGIALNLLFVAAVIGGMLGVVLIYTRLYPYVLRFCLDNKCLFLTVPVLVILAGALVWLGFQRVFGWLPHRIRSTPALARVAHAFPGLGKEFMPPLDEGSFLYMPTTMPHASVGEVLDILQKQDKAISAIPEVEEAVGKFGRADTPLDPAPVSMIETVINYRPRFLCDRDGRPLRFRYDADGTDLFRDGAGKPVPAPDGEPYTVRGSYARDGEGRLIPERGGRPFRLWRPPLDSELNPGRKPWPGINSPDDIWERIVDAAQVPGATSAPKLQPIETRIVMLQSGMRSAFGVKVKGPDLAAVERTGVAIERVLQQAPSIDPETVSAERIVGKPYLEIEIDRAAIGRYGLRIADVQQVIEVAIGGRPLTYSIEGRERYPIRVRYLRELRDSPEALGRILIPTPGGVQVPLEQLAKVVYVRGPQMIRNEDTFLTGYVVFDKRRGWAEVEVVQQARALVEKAVRDGRIEIPAGVSYSFAGSFQNQVRAARRLRVVLPLALLLIFLILHLNFRSSLTALFVFSGVAVAWAGGFILIWFYGQPWFLDFQLLGVEMRDLFQVAPINLSVAIWVGFLALFGIATDDGVVMGSYIQEQLAVGGGAASREEIRRAVLQAGLRRIRPCMMTTATTVLALLPVLTSSGRGSDILVPMAIPSFGGMTIQILTTLVVPVLCCLAAEWRAQPRRRVCP